MGFKHVMITKPAKLSVEKRQLAIQGEQKVKIPFEDIQSIVVECPEVTITAKTLTLAAQRNVAIYSCDEKRMPVGIHLNFTTDSKQLNTLMLQLQMSKPLKNRMWQKIVSCKIELQADLVLPIAPETAGKLKSLSKRVLSGDRDNREAVAAKIYFRAIFGDAFVRRKEGTVNAALNYGYAILRGAIARSLASRGFQPSLGIHHNNQLNSFNLADDLLEAFRPLVDQFVLELIKEYAEFNLEFRKKLLILLVAETTISGRKCTASFAIERMVDSLKKSIDMRNAELLLLPTEFESKEHKE